MKNFEDFDLILNHITAAESLPPFNKTFDEYKSIARLFLNHKGKFLFKEDFYKEFRKGRKIEEIFAENPQRFVQGSNKEKNGKMEPTWYDLWSMEEVEKSDSFFDYFFATRLRHLDLISIDEFLNHHLVKNFQNNKTEYIRFLNLTLRKHRERLKPDIIETVQEWLAANQAIADNRGSTALSGTKGQSIREQRDNQTCLSVVQTGILIEYLQKARIILPMDYIQAGDAFNLLTGFSIGSLRQQLGTKGQIVRKHEDFQKLYKVISELAKQIDSDIKKSKQN
jgi:hypothetical protein